MKDLPRVLVLLSHDAVVTCLQNFELKLRHFGLNAVEAVRRNMFVFSAVSAGQGSSLRDTSLTLASEFAQEKRGRSETDRTTTLFLREFS
jgi:hypothetical protein